MIKKLQEDLKLIVRGIGAINKLEPHFLMLKSLRGILNAFAPFVNIYMSGVILVEKFKYEI